MKNEFHEDLSGDIRILLSGGHETFILKRDMELVALYKWRLNRAPSYFLRGILWRQDNRKPQATRDQDAQGYNAGSPGVRCGSY